jgi:putative endonuclease
MKRYWVYILASISRRLYVGVTGSIQRRVREHRDGTASVFTHRYRIHRLVFYEATGDVRAAIAQEKRIKGWRRDKKIALIEAGNPMWDDLAAEWVDKADSSLRSE